MIVDHPIPEQYSLWSKGSQTTTIKTNASLDKATQANPQSRLYQQRPTTAIVPSVNTLWNTKLWLHDIVFYG